MRDARLAQQGERVRPADDSAERLAAVAERSGLDGALREWWAETLRLEVLDESQVAERVELLRQRCRRLPQAQSALGTCACDALERRAAAGDVSVGARLLGESAANAIRSEATNIDRLDRAVAVLSPCWESIVVLEDALSHQPHWPAEAVRLSPLPMPVEHLVSFGFDRRWTFDSLQEAERAARARGLSAYRWERHREHVGLSHAAYVRLDLLARRDWKVLAASAEDLPLRELRNDLWRHLRLHEDREAMLALLRAAPQVFEGGKWTGHTTALEALELAVTHANQLADRIARPVWTPQTDEAATAAAARELERDELPGWFRQVVQTARARSDCRPLLLFLAAHIVKEAHRPSTGSRKWSSAHLAIAAIQAGDARAATLNEVREIAKLGLPEGAHATDHITQVVVAAVFSAPAADVWAWYCDLLDSCDEDTCWQARTWPRAPAYNCLADILAQLPDPLAALQVAWRRLFVPDRERARFDRTSQSALLPSLHLIRVGLALLRKDPARDGARGLWTDLRQWISNLIADDLRLGTPLPRDLVAEGLDLAPAVFGDDWVTTATTERPLFRTPEFIVYAASAFLDGGAPLAKAQAALGLALPRLVETVNEVRSECDLDDNLRRHCEYVLKIADPNASTHIVPVRRRKRGRAP